MKAESQKIFNELWEDVVWLNGKWNIVNQLFYSDPCNIELLNRKAFSFFRVIKRTLLDDILLSICRIIDPDVSFKGDENCSLNNLIATLDEEEDKLIIEKLNNLIKDSEKNIQTIKKIRDKKLAHKDLKIALSNNEESQLSINQIRDVIQIITKFMNSYQSNFERKETAYENFEFNTNGKTIIEYLKQSDKYLEIEKQKISHLK